MMQNRTRRAGALAAIAAGSLALMACGTAAPPTTPVELQSGAGGSDLSSQPLPGGASMVPERGAAPPPEAATQVATVDGEYEVKAGDAAVARFAVAGRQVTLVDLVRSDGWQQISDDREFDEVELGFIQDQSVVRLEAKTDDGRFETETDIDSTATPARLTYPVADAGSVTIDVSNGFVGLVSQEAADGWVATVDQGDLAEGEIEIKFRNDSASRSAEFSAETDDGRLNVDIDNRIGPDHAVPGR